MNYTKPNEENYEDTPQDWLYSALAFSQALNITIPQGKGVVVELKGDALEINKGITKIIVHNDGDMMSMQDITDNIDLNHGDWVEMRPVNFNELKN